MVAGLWASRQWYKRGRRLRGAALDIEYRRSTLHHMTKPLTYDRQITFRLSSDMLNALTEACGGAESVHPRLRALIAQYIKKRLGERTKAPGVTSS